MSTPSSWMAVFSASRANSLHSTMAGSCRKRKRRPRRCVVRQAGQRELTELQPDGGPIRQPTQAVDRTALLPASAPPSLPRALARSRASGGGLQNATTLDRAHGPAPLRKLKVSRGNLGDVLMSTRLERLARSTRDLLNILDTVGKAGATFKSIHDAWADTTTPHGRLMLTVLGGLAEFERALILARTGEGRKRAKERGVRFGRPRKLTPYQRQEALKRLAAGETQADVARTYAVDPTTIGRLLLRLA